MPIGDSTMAVFVSVYKQYFSLLNSCISLSSATVFNSISHSCGSLGGTAGGNRNQILKRFWILAAISIKSHFPSFPDRKVERAHIKWRPLDNLKCSGAVQIECSICNALCILYYNFTSLHCCLYLSYSVFSALGKSRVG